MSSFQSRVFSVCWVVIPILQRGARIPSAFKMWWILSLRIETSMWSRRRASSCPLAEAAVETRAGPLVTIAVRVGMTAAARETRAREARGRASSVIPVSKTPIVPLDFVFRDRREARIAASNASQPTRPYAREEAASRPISRASTCAGCLPAEGARLLRIPTQGAPGTMSLLAW
jgi:hypothetical protein